jgi:hypothetical protein
LYIYTLTTIAADQIPKQDVRIFFDNLEVGYICIQHFNNTIHECDEEHCPIQGDIYKEDDYLSSDYIINEVINRPTDDPESIKWPQYQNIKTISFEFKNSFLYYSTYDYEYVPLQNNQKLPTASHLIPIVNIESIDLHREPRANMRLLIPVDEYKSNTFYRKARICVDCIKNSTEIEFNVSN